MAKEKKYSVARQILSILASHLSICFATGFLVIVFLGVSEHKTIKIILSIVCAFIYVTWMISAAYAQATFDNCPYTPLKPHPAKGLLLSVGTAALVGIIWILYILVWKYMPMTDTFKAPTLIVMILYIYVTSPFSLIMNISGPTANLWGQIASVAVPIIACTFGYYSGYKKWDLSKYTKIIMFEKKK